VAPDASIRCQDLLAQIVINEIEVLGSRCGPMNEAVIALTRGEIDVVSLISKRLRLSDGVKILQAAAAPGVLKVLVAID
jgi:threonine dehydrogenase-like Zn-dependent dehydrogenase